MRTTAFDKNVIIFFVIFNLVFLSVLIVRAAIGTEKCPDKILMVVSSDKVKTGDAVTFLDKTKGVDKREWNFGDKSAPQFESEVTYTYQAAGEYTVTLKVNGICADSQMVVVTERILPPQIMAPKAAYVGERIDFSGIAKNGEKWRWQFGDGSESQIQEPAHIYDSPGTFTVKLRINNDPELESKHSITVRAKPAAGTVRSPEKRKKPELRNLTDEVFKSMLMQVRNGQINPDYIYEYICDIREVKVFDNSVQPVQFVNYVADLDSRITSLPAAAEFKTTRGPGNCINEIKVRYK